MTEARGRLKITVKNALQLPVVKHHTHVLGLGPRMNPYVVLTLGSESRQTRSHSGGHRDPIWNDQVTFDMMPGLGDLEIKVLHKGHISGRDTEIAFGKISAESLRSSLGTDVRVPLSGTGVGPGSGLLTMNVIFEKDQTYIVKHRSSSVDTPIRRGSLLTNSNSQGSNQLQHAMSQRTSDDSGRVNGGSNAVSPRQGLDTPVSSSGLPGRPMEKPDKKKSWKKSIFGHSKKDSKEDRQQSILADDPCGVLSNRSSAPEGIESIPSRPVPEDVLHELPDMQAMSPFGNPRVGVNDRPAPGGGQDTNPEAFVSTGSIQPPSSKFISPERSRPEMPARKPSGLRMPPAEEYPIRTKTQWLEDKENRRHTDSSMADTRPSGVTDSHNYSRRMTETGERPSAPMYEANAPLAEMQEPQRAHFKGGREVKEWVDFHGPVPNNMKLPYMSGFGEQDVSSWNLSSKNNRQETNHRDWETRWDGQEPGQPQRWQPSAATAPIMEGAMQSLFNRQNPAQSSQGGNAPQASMQIPRQSGVQAASSGMNHLHHDYSSHYPQPEFNDIAGTSLSDRMGGFDLGKGNSVFANLLHPRDSDENAQSKSQSDDPSTLPNMLQGQTNSRSSIVDSDSIDEPKSLKPYQSPFAAETSDYQRDEGQPPTSATFPGSNHGSQATRAQFMTRPFREVKSQMEAVEADEVVVRKADIPDALSSLHGSDTLDKDSYVIDESELTIAVDSKGHPVQLGKGSFGEVFKGELNFSPVAIKVLNVSTPKSLKVALSEMKLLQQIHHSHIVHLMGYTITEEVDPETQVRTVKKLKLVTELLDGSLWDALRKEKFTWHKGGAQVAWEVTVGLYQMQKKGIRHLDLKSQNILLTDNGHAKIADFGLATVVGVHQTTRGVGTFEWAAPELLVGNVPLSDKTDVFSLGVVFWEICTGLAPRRGCLRKLLPEEAPPEIDDLINRCIQQMDLRPSVEEILGILKKFVPT